MAWGIISKARYPRDNQVIAVGMDQYVTPMPTKGDIMWDAVRDKWLLNFCYPYKTKAAAQKDFKQAKSIWMKTLLAYDTFHPSIIKEQK